MIADPTRRTILDLLKDSTRSGIREKLLEHLFLAELLQEAWVQGYEVSVMRAEVDAWGYDLVLKAHDVVRLVQLKSGAKGRSVTVHSALGSACGACIIKMEPHPDRRGHRVRLSYRFLGGRPSEQLDLGDAPPARQLRYKRDGTKSARVNHVKLGARRFGPPMTMAKLVRHLFQRPGEGDAP
jgi:hypothetical protein